MVFEERGAASASAEPGQPDLRLQELVSAPQPSLSDRERVAPRVRRSAEGNDQPSALSRPLLYVDQPLRRMARAPSPPSAQLCERPRIRIVQTLRIGRMFRLARSESRCTYQPRIATRSICALDIAVWP